MLPSVTVHAGHVGISGGDVGTVETVGLVGSFRSAGQHVTRSGFLGFLEAAHLEALEALKHVMLCQDSELPKYRTGKIETLAKYLFICSTYIQKRTNKLAFCDPTTIMNYIYIA